MKKISVVIPAYNVELYIDQCLESVCVQTYQNLEIIVVYDESSDQTYRKCLDWERRDRRIRLIYNQSRNGLGAARNQAILKAEGEYITFLDSDDWMESTYIQRLYDFIEKKSADFVASSEWYAVDDKGISIKRSLMEMAAEGRDKDIIFTLHPTAWGKLFKRDWMVKNKISFPEIFTCEDWGILPCMILQANRIWVMREPGIFHRVARAGALTDLNEQKIINLLKDAKLALQHILNYAEDTDLFKKNEFILEKYCRKVYDSYSWQYKKENDKDRVSILEEIKTDVLQKYFPEMFRMKNIKCYLFGSFSLRWEFQQAFGNWNECMKHYCFSSVISAMTPCPKVGVKHENNFRKTQIEYDITADMVQTISNDKEEAFFIIDFLEERYGVTEIFNNCYCTYSEALKESNLGNQYDEKRMEIGSYEFWNVWTEKCNELVQFLRQHFAAERVILVCNRMACTYADGLLGQAKEFKDKEKLLQINEIVGKMEDYFIAHFQRCIVIHPSDRYFITDRHFRQGCKPEHINDVFYEHVGLKLYEKIIWQEEQKLRGEIQ